MLLVLALAAPAHASDKGECRRARKNPSVDAWTAYVLANPQGRCVDEAVGELVVLTLGRFVTKSVGDPTQVALALAQLSHTDGDLLSGLLGGGMGGLGGLGGLGALGGSGGLGAFGAGGLFGDGYGDGGYGDGGYGLLGELTSGDAGDSNTIYLSFLAESVEGPPIDDALYRVVPEVQACWTEHALPVQSANATVAFELQGGHPKDVAAETSWVADGAPHPEIGACIAAAVTHADFLPDAAGKYRYRVEFY